MGENVFREHCSSPECGDAAAWLTRTDAGITVAIDGIVVELRSANRSAQELETIWLCARANERLLRAGRGHRAAMLDDLLR